MNREYIQNLRYKLQKRVRRLNSTGYQLFHYSLKQFWGFLQAEPIFVGLIDELEAQADHVQGDVDKLFESRDAIAFETEQEYAVAACLVIKRCALSDDRQIELNVSRNYSNERRFDDSLESFKDIFLEPFYDYLDEHIDDQSMILSLLKNYKHKCEWFKRQELYGLWEGETQKGEKNLALHLYEYLHDQGIKFSIEPASVSGEADIVSSQTGEEPLLADAKIFNPEKSKGTDYIAKGFRQIYSYALDYNEPFGFLIIYKTSETDLRCAFPNADLSTPYIQHNNKTIFFIVVDIYPHEKSASKRGKLSCVDLTEDTLISALDQKEKG